MGKINSPETHQENSVSRAYKFCQSLNDLIFTVLLLQCSLPSDSSTVGKKGSRRTSEGCKSYFQAVLPFCFNLMDEIFAFYHISVNNVNYYHHQEVVTVIPV